jgi:50S ribosome-binding GTPase
VPASELIERVAQLIDHYQQDISGESGAELAALGRRLREPVRVAVIGRVKAGKSTMVNALLGQRVAPTDVSECTRVVTWFRYGSPQRLVIQMSDGSMIERQLAPSGLLPAELGVPLDSVVSLHAFLANEPLKSMTLIDTPGLGSVHPAYSATTEDLLAASRSSSAAADRADAVIYLMNQVPLEDERDVLLGLQSGVRDPLTAVRALGVLSRADQLGDGSVDSWSVAVDLAQHYSAVLRDQVSSVVAVIGLLAETAATAALTEHDGRALKKLVELPPNEFVKLTWSADRFLSTSSPLDVQTRQRLLDSLGLYGIQVATDLLRSGVVGAGALRRELAVRSGIEGVRRSLAGVFGEQEHVLKVRSVLASLSRLSYHHTDRPEQLISLRNAVEALRLDPVMHPIAEVEAWQLASLAEHRLPDRLHADLRALVMPGTVRQKLGMSSNDDADPRPLVAAALTRWRTFLNTEASPTQQAVARVVLRSYQLIWTGLS